MKRQAPPNEKLANTDSVEGIFDTNLAGVFWCSMARWDAAVPELLIAERRGQRNEVCCIVVSPQDANGCPAVYEYVCRIFWKICDFINLDLTGGPAGWRECRGLMLLIGEVIHCQSLTPI